MVTSQTLTPSQVSTRIANSERLEVYFDPERGLDVDVDGVNIVSAREFHLILTTHSGGSIKIRCHQKINDVDDWHDIVLPADAVYSAMTRSKDGS